MADLITLTEAKASLRQVPGFVADDPDILDLISSATPVMEYLCGPITARACDEWHDGGGRNVRLLQYPIVSVTSVVECYGAGYHRTLAEQVLDGTTFDSFGYTVDKTDGVITRRTSGVASPFVGGRRNVHVVYTAGRATVPPHLKRAARRLIRWLWQSEMQGQRGGNSTPEAIAATVPNAIKQLCGPDLQIPGIG